MSKESLLTQEYLKKVLHYNPLTGIFTWKERPVEMFSHCQNPEHICASWNTRFAGRIAGHKWDSKNLKVSYIIISIKLDEKLRLFRAHRLAILYTEGRWPPANVDHIDGNGLNNKRANLRKVSGQENSKNRPISSNNTSGYVGVSWSKKAKKWLVSIQVNGKYKHGGLFTDKSDAIAKRKQMEIEYKFHSNHGRNAIKAIYCPPIGRKVICLNSGQIFESCKEAEQKTGIAGSSIAAHCRGNLGSAGKDETDIPLFWTYEDFLDKNADGNYILPYIKIKMILCVNTNKKYKTITDASRDIGIEEQDISSCVNGISESAGEDINSNPLTWKRITIILNKNC